MRRKLILLLPLVLLAGVAIWRIPQSSPIGPPPPIVPAPGSPPPAPTSSSAFHWDTTEVICYELTYRVAASPSESWTLRSRLAVKAVTPVPCFLFRFLDPVTSEDPAQAALFAETPVRIRFESDGRIRGIDLPASLNSEDATRLANLFASFQIVLRLGDRYQTVETDANGDSTWQYTVTGGTLQKSRLYFNSKPGDVFRTKVDASEVTAVVGDFWIDSIQGHESITVTMAEDGGVLAEPGTSWTLRRIPTPDGLSWDAAPSIEWTAATDPRRPPPSEIEEGPRFTGLTVKAALERLSGAVIQAEDAADAMPEIEALAEFLRENPAQAAELAVLLRDRHLDHELTACAMHALELAGRDTAAAQSALAAILREGAAYSPEALSQAIVAAGGVGTLQDPALQEALATLATADGDPMLGDAATLALGRLAETNPGVSALITPGLEEMIGHPASSTKDLTIALWTLRNGRIVSDSLRTRAEELSRSADEAVRAAALDYLKLYPAPDR